MKLRCCSSVYAYETADKLAKGGCDNSIKLILLNDYIDLLLKYDLADPDYDYDPDVVGLNTPSGDNCLTEEQFLTVLQNAIDICGLCNCGTNETLIID